MDNSNKRGKELKKKIITILLLLVSLTGLVFSGINIINWKIDSDKTNEKISEIQNSVNIELIQDNKKTEVIEQVEQISINDPYWDYINMNMIDADISELKKINQDTAGWIQVNGTNINYPFVQGEDNDYYLKHTFDKTYNNAGWVFLDYRNKLNEANKNIIIYAHSRTNGTMFGSLKNILKDSWLNNTNNHVVKLSTEHENTLWQVFSVYKIPVTSDYLKVDFETDTEYQEFLDMISNRKVYNFNTTVNSNDRILTLSTCYNNGNRVVLHAKLIKKEIR